MSAVAEHLAAIRAKIEAAAQAAGRDPGEITLVAVSKRQPDDKLLAAYEAGQRDFGENYVQELERKRTLLPPDARWHQIGHVQTNKARKVVAAADLVHTLDSTKLGRALSKAAAALDAEVRALVEVNLAGEAQKAGIAPDSVLELLKTSEAWARVHVEGLMCIPPADEGPRWFPELARLRARLQDDWGKPLPRLSMGMSADFEAAIRAGATLVRVGTAVFGPRDT